MPNRISIIIPAKDEPLLQQLVDEVNLTLERIPHEIVVVDKSMIPPFLVGAEVILQKSKGLGSAILEALPHTHGDLIVTMDGDYSHHPNELLKLLDAAKGYDIVLGSRFTPGGRTLDSGSRKIVSRFYRWLANVVLRLPLADPMSGFCAAGRDVYDAVKLNPIGYKVNLELIYKARRKGFTVTEVPITFYPRRAGHSNAGILEAVRTFTLIFALRLGLR